MKKILEKWKKLPVSAKSSIAFAFSSFFLKGIMFITTPIFTRIMNTTQYGVIATYNSWVSILEILALLGLTSAGVFNVGLNDNKDEKSRNNYLSNCLVLCNISTLSVFLVILIIKLLFGSDILLPNNLLIIMFIHFLFSPAQIFWITRQRYEYKYKLSTIVTIISVFIGQILSVIFVLIYSENGGFAKIFGNEIGTLLFAIPIYLIILRKGKDYLNLNSWKKILVFAIPLLPHYLAQHIMSSSDRIMISNMVSISDAGIYNVVSYIGMIGTIFWNAINGSLIPYTFEKINKKKFEDINRISKMLLISYFIVCIGIMLIAPEILNVLAPKKYYKGIYVVPPITFVVFLQALYNLFANIEFYHKKSKNIAAATIIATIINLVLNYIFIPKYSFIAAAYTTLFSYIVLILMHYLGYKSCKNKIYDTKYIFIITTVLLILSLLCNLLYINNIIRYIFILMLLLVIYLERKKILRTIKEIKSK